MKHTYVPPTGPRNAKLGVCGEQPGVQEVRWKPRPTPFVGPAGKGQDSCMQVADINRRECYLTNVIKDLDAPLRKYIDLDSRGKYAISENGWTYINELGNELKSLNLNAIVAYGNIALIALTNRVGITKWRGSVLDSTLVPGLKVVPTFHPSTFIPPKFNFLNKPLICFDLKRAKYESEFKELRREARNVKIRPSFSEAVAILKHAYDQGLHGTTIDLDIEVINEELDCISIATSPHNSVSIPFRHSQGDYFTIEQEHEVMLLIETIMSEERISKRGANFIFDCQFLLHKYGIVPRGNIHCTQIAQKISFPDFAAGLDFVTSMHTDIPYYKIDGKKWIKTGVGSWDAWWTYNGMDTIATAAAFPHQMEDLRRQGNIETYDRQRKLVKPLLYIMGRGIQIDVEGMMKERNSVNDYINEKTEELNKKIGFEINPNSPQQLQKYFYEDLKCKPYKKRSYKGQYVTTCDENAMKRLARKGYDEARMVLDLRRARKRLSTYLDIRKIDRDGRYRSSYKPVGAETGRLSSGQTIFGTGGNQQNIPHDILRFFIFDEGYIGYSFDLSQIENRIVAYVGGIIPMIEAFEQERDLHTLTASMIFRKPYDEISSEDGSSQLGDGRQSERFWGKKCKFENCQVLTKNGWIGISQAYMENTEIAQWSKVDGTISFVTPIEWFTEVYSGKCNIITNQRIYQEATPNHKMPLYYKGSIIDTSISKYPKSGKYSAPLSGTYREGTSNIPDPLIRLIVAFQADGYWNHNAITFNLYKKRKIKRLKAILELASIPYSDNSSGIYISAKHDFCKFINLILGRNKLFGSWLLNLDQNTLNSFLDELPYWDGYRLKNQYFTIDRNNAEWVQTIAHLCNRAANISEQNNSKTSAFGNKIVYKVGIRETIAPATHAIARTVKDVRSKIIYCPTVSSGYFLCKEKGIISVTGNCNHALNYDLGYKSFALTCEMPEKEAKWISEGFHTAYPQIRQSYHTLIQSMLKTDRTITNLFGRKRMFMGPVIPNPPQVPLSACVATYREGYAHFPQSTTADKINEQGINYIYYNQEDFGPVELLSQIHDSVVFQIPLSIPWKIHADILLKIKRSLETPMYWRDTRIVIPADLSIGRNMCKESMREIKSKDIPNNTDTLANKLEKINEGLRQT